MGKKPTLFEPIGDNFDEVVETLLIKTTKKTSENKKDKSIKQKEEKIIIKSKDFATAMTIINVDKKANEYIINNDTVETSLLSSKIVSYEIKIEEEEKEYEIHTINISKDLWKIALLIMTTKPGGIITTTELIEEIPNYIISPPGKETKYIKVIKNLKSNRKNKANFINQGYITDIRGGYQITKKGLDFVKEEFKDYI